LEVIILAGGLGTRLKGVINDVPKPMAPINEKPFLSYLMNQLIKNGITKIILSVGYKNQFIRSYFGDNYKNIPILYSIEKKPLGTGGAIKKAIDLVSNKLFLIVNGDTFFETDIKDIKSFFLKKKSDMLIVLKEMNNFSRYGSVNINKEYRITSFDEKKFVNNGFINSGIYFTKKDILKFFPKKDVFSFEKDFLEIFFNKIKIDALIKKGYFIDIGIPDDYYNFVKKNAE
jgi:D-glycero-alpha-D-manno-heptose 1-phosphate guanylyltransferase